jgi:hypothetical protein
MEGRSIIFSVRIASLGLQSQVGILHWPLFGKVLLPTHILRHALTAFVEPAEIILP